MKGIPAETDLSVTVKHPLCLTSNSQCDTLAKPPDSIYKKNHLNNRKKTQENSSIKFDRNKIKLGKTVSVHSSIVSVITNSGLVEIKTLLHRVRCGNIRRGQISEGGKQNTFTSNKVN